MRDVLEKKMTGLLIGLKNGTKNTTEALPILNKLKAQFPLIAQDYERKYIEIVAARKQAA